MPDSLTKDILSADNNEGFSTILITRTKQNVKTKCFQYLKNTQRKKKAVHVLLLHTKQHCNNLCMYSYLHPSAKLYNIQYFAI